MGGTSYRWILRAQSIALFLVAIYIGWYPPDPCRSSCAVVWSRFMLPDPTDLFIGGVLLILGIVGLIQSFRITVG